MDKAQGFAIGGMISSVGDAGLSIWGAIEQSAALERQKDFIAQQTEFNRQFAEVQAEDAIRRGEIDVNKIRRKAEQVRGEQRASLAAQGINIDTGSAADIQNDTTFLSTEDIITTRNNAAREAFGYKAQAIQGAIDAQMQRAGLSNQQSGTILTGISNAGRSVARGIAQYGDYQEKSRKSGSTT